MRLVVCVDRDDDLGRKAGVEGPVVGREAVLQAAAKLGTADPEDADTNAMYASVHLLDELRNAGEEADVAVLTGSPKVGVLSDRRVAQQFDRVLDQAHAESAHLVSDGAEDEFLFPILASRIRVDGVHRVYVRQNASLEGTYYTLVRALKDPKLRAKTVLPFAIVMLVLGIAAASGLIWWGVIGLLILLGVYLIFWTFDIDEAVIDSVRSASTDIRQGSVAFGFGLFAIALVGVGFLLGYNVIVAMSSTSPLAQVLAFSAAGAVWWVLGAEVWETGRALRRYIITSRLPRSYPIATTSIVGIGFLSYGIVYLVQYLEAIRPPSQLPVIIGALVAGLGMVIAAGVLQQYFKTRGPLPSAGTSTS